MKNKEKGSVLVPALAMVILMAGLASALMLISVAHARSSNEDLDQELAVKAADSGFAYYYGELSLDANYFNTYPAPHAAAQVGDATYTLQSAVPGASANEWGLTIDGSHGRGAYSMNVVIGNASIRFPDGIVVGGTGNDSNVVVSVTGSGLIGSYDPGVAAFDPTNPGSAGNIAANGSLNLGGTVEVEGNVHLSGTLQSGDPSQVDGTLTESGTPTPIDNIDPIVLDKFNASQASNDNASLSAIFGPLWFDLGGAENYGDLVVDDGGTYIVPAGTYRFRTFEVRNSSRVIFDTSGGPADLIYVGAGAGTGTGNDLTLFQQAQVLVDSGGTTNGLLTVLGPDADFRVLNQSVYGQNISDPDSGGYTQIISMGGNASSDVIEVANIAKVYARLYAAAHELQINNTGDWYGSAVVRSLDMQNTATFAVDESSLGKAIVDPSTFAVLARWKA